MFEFELPDLGEGVAEGEVLAWHVAVGDSVQEDDVLAEVETDKAAVDVPAPVDGVVRELHADVGETVATGDVLVRIEEDEDIESGASEDESAEPEPTDNGSTADGRVFAPPSVRQLAREEGIDITTVEGSGPGGRITEADVEAAAESSGPTPVVSKVSDDGDDDIESVDGTDGGDGPAVKSAVRKASADTMTERREHTLATPATRRLARELGVDIDAVPTDETRDGEPYVDATAVRAVAERDTPEDTPQAEPGETGSDAEADTRTTAPEGGRREPYAGIRRTIGEQMARSRQEVPHATHHDKVAVPGLVDARARLQPLAEDRGVHLTYTPFLLKSVAAALDEHPILATQLDTEHEEIVYRDERAIGVATATDHGLVVPVVDGVDGKGLLEIAADLNDLVERARERDIAREEMQGGVFTVTNFGAIGGEYADPIINVPETAILGVGALKERPVADDGEVTAEPTLTLSLSIDHRVIDGADAARFVNTLKAYLADPTRLLLD